MIGPWRLELLRLVRTRRLVALAAAFLLLGLGIPLLTYYLPALVKHASGGIRIVARKPTPADAIAGYASNAGQLGTLVMVIVTAATLAIDAHPTLAVFYRTRLRAPQLLLPRYATITAAGVAALALGTVGAWYETTILLGAVPVAKLSAGFALEAVWLWFTASVVAAFGSAARSAAAAAGAAIALLLAIALLADVPELGSWLPTRLADGVAVPFNHPPARDLWRPVVVAVVTSCALVAAAVARVGRRRS